MHIVAARNVVFATKISWTVQGMIFPPQKVAPWSQFQRNRFPDTIIMLKTSFSNKYNKLLVQNLDRQRLRGFDSWASFLPGAGPGKMGTSLPSTRKTPSQVGQVSGKQSMAHSAGGGKSQASKVGAPRKQVKWGLVATSIFYGLLFFTMAACGVGIYIFANRKPPSELDPSIQNRYVRACYATSKKRLGVSDDYMQHCVKLTYPYHQNCVENECNKLDFQFNENTGEFQRIEAVMNDTNVLIKGDVINIEIFSPDGQLCDLRSQSKCYQNQDQKWMCNEQLASLTYIETALSSTYSSNYFVTQQSIQK
uniref:Uncharacterized protein n=1 Tax=Romanomermis culicivorax TaxID=13658 RepID=A0A915HNJ1_ROMCU